MTATTALAAVFADPVHDALGCFRTIMNAMARPGTLQVLGQTHLAPPAPLTPAAAAIALTLFDYDTTVWLDKQLAKSESLKTFLLFHTGEPILSEPVVAAFALIADPANMLPLASFNQGSAEYPDTSTTLILTCQNLNNTDGVVLEGPGIKDTQTFETGPVPQVFWDQVISNNAQFPRGVDLIFAGKDTIAALPRSTSVTLKEA